MATCKIVMHIYTVFYQCVKWYRNCWKLMHLTAEEECILVEEKNCFVNCNLYLESDKVAQVLRQAQIVIEGMKLSDITFVRTNSVDWSFGMA